LVLIILGLILGILALVLTKQHERRGIFGKALLGTCVNGFLLTSLLAVPLLLPRFIGHKYPATPQGRLDRATGVLTKAPTDEKRFYALDAAAKESFNAGKIEDANDYAKELLRLAPNFQGDWNYGNAIQDGNLVLGRIAVRDGRIEDAKRYLLEAGKSPGSPQMNSFGPNMSLAKDLLQKGERDTILQYFGLCRRFWTMDYGKLDQWSAEVKAGKIPAFGANLVY
jgi:tetratricopeptide (TPR) repeat protein